MKEDYFTIGQVSKMKGITIKALRFYDRIGLLKPNHIDPNNQYRYYHISQLVYLDIIKAARMMDISPNELIPFFKSKDSNGLEVFLDKQMERTRQRIHDLNRIILSIDEVKKSIQNAKTAGINEEVYSRQLPDRFAVTVPYVENKTMKDIFLDYSDLYLTLERHGFINTYEEGLIFTQNDRGEFYPGFLCNFVTNVNDEKACKRIPGGSYVCVCYTKEKAEVQMNRLWEYLSVNQLEPLDLIQVGLLTDLLAEEIELLELQVRIC